MSRHVPLRASADRGAPAVLPRRRGVRVPRREPLAAAKQASDRGKPLSAADAAFLYLERKEIPLAIACLTIFDGPIPFEEFVADIASKVHRVPRYRQVVVEPPLNLELPAWQDDPHFDVRRHIFHVAVKPPGGEAELEKLVGRIFSRVLDRNKPLWEIHVIDGLKDGRGAVIWRVHHALADGVSGARLLEVFLEPAPDAAPAPLKRPPPAAPAPDGSKGGISRVIHTTLDSLLATEKGLLDFGEALLGDLKDAGSKGLLDLLPELLLSVERLPFNKPCGAGRKFCWAEIDLAEVQKIRAAVGGRVNDVILTILTRALARYVKLHGQSIVNRYVRIVCPVSLRKPGLEGSLGNQISFLVVALPLDVHDPAEMLRAVAARTETMKRSGAAGLVGVLAAFIAKAPPSLQALFWWGLPELILPMPLFNMICTNVPGPPAPLCALGRRMLATYPQVPTGYDLGINCAVESYDGKLFFGLIADARVGSDVNRLRDFLYVGYEELRQAARKESQSAAKKLRPPQKAAAPRKRSARKPATKRAESMLRAEPAVAHQTAATPPAPSAAGVHAP
jgi:diacylglycerol O-acyltransferase / wax synthase